MVQRIVKMIGHAYSTSGDIQVRLIYNGIEILNGPVTTKLVDSIPESRPGRDDGIDMLNELVLFETTTDTIGNIPVSITVSGGTLFFRQFLMNYTGYEQQRQATNPNIPIDSNDPSTFTQVTTVSPDSYYADPNTNTVESDGISNLTKNGRPWIWRVNVGDLLGDWEYPIISGETVTFDFFVDPANVVLAVPN